VHAKPDDLRQKVDTPRYATLSVQKTSAAPLPELFCREPSPFGVDTVTRNKRIQLMLVTLGLT